MASSSTSSTTRRDCFPCQFLDWFRTTVVPEHSRDSFTSPTPIAMADEPTSTPVVDFTKANYRAFVLVHHATHGYMLLHCTRKKSKPNHFQLPGGHVDDFEFQDVAKAFPEYSPSQQLLEAAKRGAARELYEETGMDVRQQLHRLEPARLYSGGAHKGLLDNELKERIFFTVKVTDDDFLDQDKLSISEAAFLKKPMGQSPPKLMVKLSHEHQGFIFEKYLDVAAGMLQHHSGGKVTQGVQMIMALQSESTTK